MPIAVPGTVASGWAGLTVSWATGLLAAGWRRPGSGGRGDRGGR